MVYLMCEVTMFNLSTGYYTKREIHERTLGLGSMKQKLELLTFLNKFNPMRQLGILTKYSSAWDFSCSTWDSSGCSVTLISSSSLQIES